MYRYLEDEEVEIQCPNDGCYSTIRFRYSEAFNNGQLSCNGCGAQLQLDYNRMSNLRDAVNDMQRAKDETEKAEQKLKDAMDRLLESAKMTKNL